MKSTLAFQLSVFRLEPSGFDGGKLAEIDFALRLIFLFELFPYSSLTDLNTRLCCQLCVGSGQERAFSTLILTRADFSTRAEATLLIAFGCYAV
ncbi:MAG: hypothetical protein Q7N87_05320 [Candidatus Uhrbacteria bacterium]|nr:hypothetical protein [Candidatus Uhrbacteria bacterium]